MKTQTRWTEDDGLTLIELLVVMILMGVVGVIAMQGFVSSADATRTAHTRMDALDDVRPAVQRVTRELRAANPLLLDPAGAYSTKIGAEVLRDGTRQQFWYYLTGTPGDLSLWSDHIMIAADGTETVRSSGALVTEITNDADEPVFSYYDDERQLITCDDLDVGTVDGAAACRDRHLTAAQVRLWFVRPVLGANDSVSIDTYVHIRNARYSND